MSSVNLGIIGCGIAARELHWPALKDLKDKFRITAVCNHTIEKAESFSRMVGGAPVFLKYEELLQQKSVDAVVISLPIDLNFQATKDALQAGKHVFLEKPLAANLEQAAELLKISEKFDSVKLLAENFRYRKIFHVTKELIHSGEIGNPFLVIWNVFYFANPEFSPYAGTRWRIEHQYPGGFVLDGGVHNVAALRLIFGDIFPQEAVTKSVHPAAGKIDTLLMKFKNNAGILGELNFCYSANGYAQETMFILGENGSLELNGNFIILKKSGKKDKVLDFEDDWGYTAEFVEFYDAIKNNKPVSSPFAEGYKDLDVIIKALEMATAE